jgi:hypothetical protein
VAARGGWWHAAPEARAEQGRFDILLRNEGPFGPATIVIENKWNHHLGDRQLERYGDYLAGLSRSDRDHRTCLVYITRNGEDPRLSLSVDLVCISHSGHISRLIRRTLEATGENAPPALREPLLQYCSILEDGHV